MTTTASRIALFAALLALGSPAGAQTPKFSDDAVFTFTPDAGTKDVVDQLADIKNNNSNIFHAPGQSDYASTYANVTCFGTETEAAAAGFRRAQR